jgi:hypothetical protein
MPSNADLLVQAIKEKKQVTGYYDGLYREMCPHVIGRKGPAHHVLSYQFAGESSKGLQPGGDWKCMDVDRLSQLALRDGPWHTDTHHTRPQTCVALNAIEAEVIF